MTPKKTKLSADKEITKVSFSWQKTMSGIFNLEILLVLLLTLILLIAGAQVVGRYVFSTPLVWAEELTRMLLVWMVLLGSANAVRKNVHIRLEAIDRAKNVILRRFSKTLAFIILLIVSYVCLVQGINWVNMVKGTTPALGIDVRLKYAALPVSMILYFWYLLAPHLYKILKK